MKTILVSLAAVLASASSALAGGLLDAPGISHREQTLPSDDDDSADTGADISLDAIEANVEIEAADADVLGSLVANVDLTAAPAPNFVDDMLASMLPGLVVAQEEVARTPLMKIKLTDRDVTRAISADHKDELEYCWLQTPSADRDATTGSMHFAIASTGSVTAVKVTGSLPAATASCLSSVASHWTFPAAESGTEIDHAIRLSSIR